ncbi:MAG: alanine--tRNA ligase, partial [Chlamydiae bacterium]|nr:alanine--tRNA ligase [Chlamydiota bacterium]
IFQRLLSTMGHDFHELSSAKERIATILTSEEEGFLKTLKKGGSLLSSIITEAQKHNLKEISGEDAFKLKDTYGFPLEEILLIAKDNHVQVNLETFDILEAQAKERSKKAKEIHHQEAKPSDYQALFEKYGPSRFIGYTDNEAEATIIAILKQGHPVELLEAGEEATILLEQTPFYAEKGGQVADIGELRHERAHFVVEDCQTPLPGMIVHHGVLKEGTLLAGEPVLAQINMERREQIENNHSATHLLHWALQRVLGEHIKQAGSLVEPDRLRFDFNHHQAITAQELRQIEHLVNLKIRTNSPVKSYELSYEEVQGRSDVKQFFGDKYGSEVRLVDIADFSKELCGGTHVPSLGRLGFFKIVKESSIAKGVRRIEAVTGKQSEALIDALEDKLDKIASLLGASSSQTLDKLAALLQENTELKQQAKKLRAQELAALTKKLKESVVTVNAKPYLCAKVPLTPAELSGFTQTLAAELPHVNLLLGIDHEGKCQLVLRLGSELAEKGVKASDFMVKLAPLIQGSGGGKGPMAQAGGTLPEGLEKAFALFKTLL